MGLLPEATDPSPAMRDHFVNTPGSPDQIAAFAGWWDEQTDPEAAVAAVWDEPLE